MTVVGFMPAGNNASLSAVCGFGDVRVSDTFDSSRRSIQRRRMTISSSPSWFFPVAYGAWHLFAQVDKANFDWRLRASLRDHFYRL